VSGKRPDDWTLDRLEEMADMAERMASHISDVVKTMKEAEIDTLALQARKKWSALNELLTWSEFDLRKAVNRQSAMRTRGSFVAETAKKSRRK